MADQTVKCPDCGVTATGWRDVYKCFKRLYRPEPRDGQVWPQVWQCYSCGMRFGDPYPASIEADLEPQLDKRSVIV